MCLHRLCSGIASCISETNALLFHFFFCINAEAAKETSWGSEIQALSSYVGPIAPIRSNQRKVQPSTACQVTYLYFEISSTHHFRRVHHCPAQSRLLNDSVEPCQSAVGKKLWWLKQVTLIRMSTTRQHNFSLCLTTLLKATTGCDLSCPLYPKTRKVSTIKKTKHMWVVTRWNTELTWHTCQAASSQCTWISVRFAHTIDKWTTRH